MWRILPIALAAACGTADMLEGLPCATDADCLGYFCTAGKCEPPPDFCPHGAGQYCGGDGVPGVSSDLYHCERILGNDGSIIDFSLQQTCAACGVFQPGGQDECVTPP